MINSDAILGLMIPFLGTSLGAAAVFFMKHTFSENLSRALTGFAAGVMIAASVWSLIIPAIEQSEHMGRFSFLSAFIGFWLGILFLYLLDRIIPIVKQNAMTEKGGSGTRTRTLMIMAVTLHNIPEGMAVGVIYAGLLADTQNVTLGGALALAIGIAIQNLPEGAIISMPLHAQGQSKSRAFLGGVLSGAGADRPRDAVSAELCGRGDGVCGGRGADPRDDAGRALPQRRDVLRGRLHTDDVAGCGVGVMIVRS